MKKERTGLSTESLLRCIFLRTLPFSLPGCEIQNITLLPTGLTITASCVVAEATCPSCGQGSRRLHSYYQRKPQDLPVSGHHVQLILQVRRWCCQNPLCRRQTFVQALPAIVPRYGRYTSRLGCLLDAIAFALSSQAGARLVKQVGMQASAPTLLRRLKRFPTPSFGTPRRLGVDDFAFRRGQTYGTLLIDLETHQPVDLLADRNAETFAQWLRDHPGVEVISRDRAGTYAEGGRMGAPQAVQVADRWHLVHNLAEALEQTLKRLLALQPKREPKPDPQLQPVPISADLHLRPFQQQRREEVHESYLQVQQLYEQGQSLRSIAKTVGIDTNTLRYFVQSQPWGRLAGERGRQPGGASLDPYLPYLHKRWREGTRNGMQLWRELRGRGYTGSASSVRPYLALLRQVPDALRPTPAPRRKKSRLEKSFSTRRVIRLALAEPEQLTREQQQELMQVSSLHAEIATALIQANAFVRIMRTRKVEALPDWLASASASAVRELRAFARGVRRDRSAVEAALCREDSNGQTEGQITKLKLIKRSMYGRASFALLRQRMLHAA